jgi:putative heme transporter
MISRKTKLIINIATIIALVVLLYISWPDITKGLAAIGGAKWSIIALMIPLQIFNFFAVGMIYNSYFKSLNYKSIKKSSTLKVALELNFVNSVFPSGGVAGFTYLGYRLKHFGIPVARTTLAQTLRFGLTFLSFLILLFAGLFMLSIGKQSSGVTLYIGLSVAFMTLFGTLLVMYIVSDLGRIKAFTAFLPKLVNSLLKPFTKKRSAIDIGRIEKLFTDLHFDFEHLMKKPMRLKKPFAWALVVNITEVVTIYLAYIALGQPINPGAVILAYSIASFAGLIAIFPGGIGVYEALMTTTLAAAGVPKALALSATLIYRIFTMVIFVPTGFILYQKALKRGEAEDLEHVAAASTHAD